MTRFFVAPAAVQGETVTLTGPDAHHAATVLRLKPGAAVTAADGTGAVYACAVAAVARGEVVLQVASRSDVPPPPVAVTLVQALPKGDKLELVIQKATELGAARVVPLAARHSVVKIEAGKAEAKRARWAAIAREAAEQSERATVPEVTAPTTLAALAAFLGDGPAFVLAERTAGRPLARALPAAPPAAVALVVGPEGGWAPEELAALRQLGCEPVSLGPRILRTETAAIAAVAVVMAAYEG